MAITHFIAGAHKCLINEFPYTRAGPFERFMRWQRTHAPGLAAMDDDLQKAIGKVETKELKRDAQEATQHQRPPPKLLRRWFVEGPSNRLAGGYVMTNFELFELILSLSENPIIF